MRLKKKRLGDFGWLSAIIFATAIAFVIYLAVVFKSQYDDSLNSSFSHARDDVHSASLRVDTYFSRFHGMLDLVSYDLDSLISRHAPLEDIAKLIVGQNRHNNVRDSEILGFYGVFGGTFISYDATSVDVTETAANGYDPTLRAWYVQAVEGKGAIVCTPPYRDINTGIEVVTFSKVLEDGASVVAIDVDLSKLPAMVADYGSDELHGYTLIFTDGGDLISHPEKGRVGENWLTGGNLMNREFFMRAHASTVCGRAEFPFAYGDLGEVYAFAEHSAFGFDLVTYFPKSRFTSAFLKPIFGVWALFFAVAALVFVFLRNHRLASLQFERDRAVKAEKAKSYFFSTVSHDIRTPLNAILGFAELLQMGIDDAEERKRALESIRTSGQTLMNLINDVLDLSKLEVGKMEFHPEAVDFRALIVDVISTFKLEASGKKIALVVRAENLPCVSLDPQRFRQVLFNLLGNAMKFTESGTIAVDAAYRGKRLEFSVSDTGCGVPADRIKDLADPYVQIGGGGRHGGTGLGLAICKQLVLRLGGTLEIESEVGRGSTFRISIPDVEEADAADIKPSASGVEDPEKVSFKSVPRHILLVDDSKVNLAVLKAMLAKAGQKDIETAENGVVALEKLAKAERPFDIVLTDVWMPEMDGERLVREIRRRSEFADLPVYAVTADVEAKKSYAAFGFTGIMLKPVTLGKLAAVLG